MRAACNEIVSPVQHSVGGGIHGPGSSCRTRRCSVVLDREVAGHRQASGGSRRVAHRGNSVVDILRAEGKSGCPGGVVGRGGVIRGRDLDNEVPPRSRRHSGEAACNRHREAGPRGQGTCRAAGNQQVSTVQHIIRREIYLVVNGLGARGASAIVQRKGRRSRDRRGNGPRGEEARSGYRVVDAAAQGGDRDSSSDKC